MKEPWWRSLAQITWWIFTRLWAPFMAIGWPLLAVYGALNPSAADLTALQIQPSETAILVGTGGTATAGQRSYIVVPRVLSTGAIAIVTRTAAGPTVVEAPGAGLQFLLIWVACVCATWYFLVRPWRDTRSPESYHGT